MRTVPRGKARNGALPIESLREGEFQASVVELARGLGWGVTYQRWQREAEDLKAYGQPAPELEGVIFHPRIMYRSDPGWPDLTLVRKRDRRLIFAELKAEAGKVSPRQAAVLELLHCLCSEGNPRIQVFVWRPSDLDAIAEVLR